MYVLPLLLVAACLPSVRLIEGTPLDDYVAQVDPHYSYTIQEKEDRSGVTVYTLNMTSQKWLDETQVDRTIWWHQLSIAVAKNQTLNFSCLLMLAFGRNNNDQSSGGLDYSVDDAIDVARSTGSCAAVLKQIPNVPITFKKISMQQCKNSTEDYIIACTMWNFSNNEAAKPHSLIFFPMVKAVVRGMDTITDLLRKESGGKTKITTFTVAGLSKRGWTAYLVAAVDRRVTAAFPVAFDILNFIPNLKHQYRSYCGWSIALKFLYDMNLTRQLDSPRVKEMASYIDPFAFKARYVNKSLYINIAAGDELGLPDDSYLYLNLLKGDNYFRIIPNADHGHILNLTLKVTLLPSLKTFYVITIKNLPRPHISWTRTETNTTGAIVLHTDWVPSSVKCYHAHTNPLWNKRDFRLLPSLVLWWRCKVKKEAKGVYKVEMKKPSWGWKGFFIEVTYPIPIINSTFVLTSEVQILNNTYPCAECYGAQCYGKLVLGRWCMGASRDAAAQASKTQTTLGNPDGRGGQSNASGGDFDMLL